MTRRLAGAGAEVVLAVRNVEKGRQAKEGILAEFPDAMLKRSVFQSVASIREALQELGMSAA